MGRSTSVERGVVELHEISVRAASSAWCRLLWQDNGWVIILSDYGHWAYWWGHRGTGVSVPQFLARLDREYMGGKMLGLAINEYDPTATAQCIREEILTDRRRCDTTEDEARSEWELVEQIESGDMSFDDWFRETTFADGYEYRRTKVCDDWKYFWERLWVPLVLPELKRACESRPGASDESQ